MRGAWLKMSLGTRVKDNKFTTVHDLLEDKFNQGESITRYERAYILIEKSQEEAWF